MEYLLSLSIAAAVSLAVIPAMAAIAPRLGLIDQPDSRKVHARPVPRVGGWGIVLGTVAALLLWLPFDAHFIAYLFGAGVLFLIGTWDDRNEIGHYPKFLAQIVAVVPLVFWAELYVSQLPFIGMTLPPAIGMPFTVVALVGMINATNHSDGLDGLAGGESLLSLVAMGAIAWLAGGTTAALITVAAAGAIAGFLRHNNHPAKLFMGDAGSQFIGFTVGTVAVLLTQRVDPSLSPAVVLLLLGLPIADILVVLGRRIAAGGSWFRATRNHIHHRLLDIGLSHRGAVTIIYSIHAVLVVAGVFLRHAPDLLIVAVYGAVAVALFTALSVAERHRPTIAAIAPGEIVRWPWPRRILVATPRYLLSAGIPAYLVALGLTGAASTPTYAAAGIPLATLMLMEGAFTGSTRSLISRGLLYAGATYVVYAQALTEGSFFWQPITMVALALLLTVAIVFSPRRRRFEFHPTGLDLLALVAVSVGLVLLAAMPQAPLSPVLPLELIVIYYGIELLSVERRGRPNPLKPLLLSAVLVVVVRGLA